MPLVAFLTCSKSKIFTYNYLSKLRRVVLCRPTPSCAVLLATVSLQFLRAPELRTKVHSATLFATG